MKLGSRFITQADCDRVRRLMEAGHTQAWIAAAMKRNENTIGRIVARGFLPPPRKHRPVPADFARVCQGLSIANLCAHYRVSKLTVYKWIEDSGVKRADRRLIKGRPNPKCRPMPDDFLERYQRDGYRATERHYGAGPWAMIRWMRQCGIPPKKAKEAAKPVASTTPSPPPGYEQFKRRLGPVPTIHGLAA